MMTLPLAIYTADHGLAWTYPKQEIGFAELDACRTTLAPLPDFDMGEMGYGGVWVTAERVFVMVCQSAPKWDFRGRDATYLAVTWMSRDEAKGVDFEVLLSHPALRTPTKNPPPFIDFHQTPMGSRPIQGLPTALPNFQSVGALISALPMNQTAKIKRNLNASNVTCRYETIGETVEPQRMRTTAFTLMDQQPAPRMPKGEPRPTVIAPPTTTTSTPLIIVLILLGVSVILNLYLGWEWLNQRPDLKKKVQETIGIVGSLNQSKLENSDESEDADAGAITNEVKQISHKVLQESEAEEMPEGSVPETSLTIVVETIEISTEGE
jgi:hypothetical protein